MISSVKNLFLRLVTAIDVNGMCLYTPFQKCKPHTAIITVRLCRRMTAPLKNWFQVTNLYIMRLLYYEVQSIH